MYAEAAADRPMEPRLGDAPALKLCIQELTTRPSKARLAPKKEAKQYLTSIVILLERAVMASQEMYLRADAWLKLITIWSVIRGEDSSWLDESSLEYKSGLGLRGNLSKSKTTGPGKKTKHREVFVAVEAYLEKKGLARRRLATLGACPSPTSKLHCPP